MLHVMAVKHRRQRLKIGRAAFLLMQRRCGDPLCVMTPITGWRLFLAARVAGTCVEERAYQTQRRGDGLVAGNGNKARGIHRPMKRIGDGLNFILAIDASRKAVTRCLASIRYKFAPSMLAHEGLLKCRFRALLTFVTGYSGKTPISLVISAQR